MKIMITSVGYSKLKNSLSDLRRENREVIDEMAEAQSSCLSSDDSSEINDYKLRQSTIERRIQEIAEILENVKIIDVESVPTDKARFGAVVTLMDIDTEKTVEYRLVSVHEGDPKMGMLSVASPLGKAIIGCEVGDSVDVSTPSGDKEYEIINIEARSF